MTKGQTGPELEAYRARVRFIHQLLNIPECYGEDFGLMLCYEVSELCQVDNDIFGRPQYLTPEVALRWANMKKAAAGDDVVLQIISAFRSVDYQQQLFERKLSRGLGIGDILKVNAAPGYSEHHSGAAIDIATPGYEPLTQAFEYSSAFRWLMNNGGSFGFALSYPRDDSRGITYEPWHWAAVNRKNDLLAR